MIKKSIIVCVLLSIAMIYANNNDLYVPITTIGNTIKLGTQYTATTAATVVGGTALSFALLNVLDGKHMSPGQLVSYGLIGGLLSWCGYTYAPNQNICLAILSTIVVGWTGIGVHQKWTER